MPFAARSASLLASLAAAACAAPQSPPRTPRSLPPTYDRHEVGRGAWGDRVLVEAMAIPGAWLTRDLDGTRENGDAEDAAGQGLRLSIGNRDQSIGVLWQGLHTDDDTFDVHTLGLDVDVRMPLEDGTEWFFVRAGAGIGAAWLDALADDTLGSTAAAQLRLGLDFQPTPHFMLGASFGGIVFGHPGETDAFGTFVTLGAALVF